MTFSGVYARNIAGDTKIFRQIANPEYFVDEKPYQIPTIDSIGIDIWTMDKGIIFDNIVVDNNPDKVAWCWSQRVGGG